jgi:recombination protein U
MQFMQDFEDQEGVAFFLINYTYKNLYYYMRFREIKGFWERMEQGGRKSIRFDELDKDWFFTEKAGLFVPYLNMLQKDLDAR